MRKGGVAATLSKIDCLCQMSMNQYAINKKTSVSTGFFVLLCDIGIILL